MLDGHAVFAGVAPVLAEKFCLVLETLRNQVDEYRVESTSPHVPIVRPKEKGAVQAKGLRR